MTPTTSDDTTTALLTVAGAITYPLFIYVVFRFLSLLDDISEALRYLREQRTKYPHNTLWPPD